jgi:hypothetical protein
MFSYLLYFVERVYLFFKTSIIQLSNINAINRNYFLVFNKKAQFKNMYISKLLQFFSIFIEFIRQRYIYII